MIALPNQKKEKLHKSLLFCALLITAFIVRVVWLGRNLPHLPTMTETGLAEAIFEIFNGRLKPPGFQYPGLVYYITSIPVFFMSFIPILERFMIRPSPMDYIIHGRLIVLFFSMAHLPLTYRICERLFDRKSAFIAILIIAFSPLHIKRSVILNPDMIMVLFILMAFNYCSEKTYGEGFKCSSIFISGALAGLAFSSKYPGIAIALPLVYSLKISNRLNIRTLFILLSGIASVFIITNPYLFLNLKEFIYDMSFELHRVTTSYPFEEVKGAAWGFYSLVTIGALGEGVIITGLLGHIIGLIKEKKKELLLLLFPLSYFAVMGYFRVAVSYYMLPLIPFIAVSSGRFISKITTKQGIKKHLTITLIFIPTLLRFSHFAFWQMAEETRLQAIDWVLDNIQMDSRVLIDSVRIHSVPFIDLSKGSAYSPYILTPIVSDAKADFYIERINSEHFDYSILITNKPRYMSERVKIDHYIADNYKLLKEVTLPLPRLTISHIYHPAYSNPTIRIYRFSDKKHNTQCL